MDKKTYRKLGEDHYLFHSLYFCPVCGWKLIPEDMAPFFDYRDVDEKTETASWYCSGCGNNTFHCSRIPTDYWKEIPLWTLPGLLEDKLEIYPDNPYLREVATHNKEHPSDGAGDSWIFYKYVVPLGQLRMDHLPALRRYYEFGYITREEYYAKGGKEYDERKAIERRKSDLISADLRKKKEERDKKDPLGINRALQNAVTDVELSLWNRFRK